MGKGLEQSPQCLRKLSSHPSVIFGVGLQQFLKKLSAQGKGKFDQLSATFAQDSAMLSKLVEMTPAASCANFLVMPSAPNV